MLFDIFMQFVLALSVNQLSCVPVILLLLLIGPLVKFRQKTFFKLCTQRMTTQARSLFF